MHAMKTISLRLVATLILFSTPNALLAQDDFWGMRCQVWSNPALNDFDKDMYISGLRDGLIFAQQNVQKIYIPPMSGDSTIRAVSEICEDTSNMLIPVPLILSVVVLKISGESSQAIEETLLRMRRDFAPQ